MGSGREAECASHGGKESNLVITYSKQGKWDKVEKLKVLAIHCSVHWIFVLTCISKSVVQANEEAEGIGSKAVMEDNDEVNYNQDLSASLEDLDDSASI